LLADGIRVPLLWNDANTAPLEVRQLWEEFRKPQGSISIRLFAVCMNASNLGKVVRVAFSLEDGKDSVSSTKRKSTAMDTCWDAEEVPLTLVVENFAYQRLECVVRVDSRNVGVACIALDAVANSPNCTTRHQWTIEQKRLQVGYLDLELTALYD